MRITIGGLKYIKCVPDRSRTYDLLLRRQLLYPPELQVQQSSSSWVRTKDPLINSQML